MKIRYLDDFDEEFTSEYNRSAHYQKHKKEFPNWTEEEYEKAMAVAKSEYKKEQELAFQYQRNHE